MQHFPSFDAPGAVHEPAPFVGIVGTTVDAIRLVIAARRGVIPRITRRLNDAERRSMVHSGAVFIYCSVECGIQRWTEGLTWSPSRIEGNFLVYREVTHTIDRRSHKTSKTPVSTTMPGDPDIGQTPIRSSLGPLKPNGLTKKTITVNIDGADHHVVSYYREEDISSGRLRRPTSRPDIMSLEVPISAVKDTKFRHPPRVDLNENNIPQIFDDEELAFRSRYPPERPSRVTSPMRGLDSRSTGSAPPEPQDPAMLVVGRSSSWHGGPTLPSAGHHYTAEGRGTPHRASYPQELRTQDVLLSGYAYGQASSRSGGHSAYLSSPTASTSHDAAGYQPHVAWDSRPNQPWHQHISSGSGPGAMYTLDGLSNAGRHFSG